MQTHHLPITDLLPDPANARRHNARNVASITASLARFGQQRPIVIDANNVVRAGNGTLAAAKSLGWTHIDCVRTELLGVEAGAFAIADNRSAELADWDPDLLAAALADPAIGDLAFDKDELERILKQPPPEVPADLLEPPPELSDRFQLLVTCPDELAQQDIYHRLSKEGLCCRVITL